MKKLYLLLSILCFSSTVAQDYEPLLNDYNEWHFTTCYFGCLTDRYFTAGDTIVDGLDYKVLDGYHYISRTFLLREDVSERKVYVKLVNIQPNPEYLLYDFGMEVGDSIDMKNPITPFPEDAGYYKLDEILLLPLVDGTEYRHFYLSPAESNTTSTNDAVWVEGAGSLSIINAPSGEPDINGAGHLSCSFKNSIPFYANLDSIASCEPLIVLGVNDYSDQLSDVQVETWVGDGACNLVNIENARFIDVYDLNGRLTLEYVNLGKKEAQLDFSDFNSGLYMVVMRTNQFQRKVFKVLVE